MILCQNVGAILSDGKRGTPMSQPRKRALRALGLLPLLAAAGCSVIAPIDSGRLESQRHTSIEGRFVPLKLGVSKITVRPLQAEDSAKPLVGYPGPVEVAAGPQRLFANFCAGASALLSCRAPALLEFDAEAGHIYAVDGSLNDQMWVVDTGNGAIVARSRRYNLTQEAAVGY